MRYSERPSYIEIRQKSRVLAGAFIAADLAYYMSLVGGVIACLIMLSLWANDYFNKTGLRGWEFYVMAIAVIITTSVFVLALSVVTTRWIYRHLGIDAID